MSHRFINADGTPSTGQDFNGTNMFVYCGNNPVARADNGGEFWNIVIGAVVGAVVGAVTTIVSSVTSGEEIDWVDVAVSAGVGAVSGAVAATGLGAVLQAGIAASAAFTGTIITETHDQVSNSSEGWKSMKDAKVIGGILLDANISGAISFGTSMLGSAFGKAASYKVENQAALLQAKGRSPAHLSFYTRKQLAELGRSGKMLKNTAQGISSVVGTLLTWPLSASASEAFLQ